ncbi:MAG TPA: cell surface protein SprA [Bacteroidia bacterium]|nr:cell surface protein SprA [Bacteroidia bacterium]
MFALITLSGNKTAKLLPEKPGREAINPFIKTTVKDTPPEEGITNDDLRYPIRDNDYGEPVYNPKAPMQLNSASNIKTTTTYNPKDSSYTFEQKMGALNYRPPIYMTEEEYKDYQFKQQVKSYWKSRTQADSKSDPTKKQLIPQLKVGGELFDRLFGGNTVDIRPTGSAELLFGVITNRNENPAIPQKQRKISNFDFNMKIQLNIVGKIGEKLKLTTNYNTEASFDFENQIKIQYTGTEDEILKKVEAGNVNLPLNSSLITGSQTLFGVKTTMQFGKLTATALVAQERGKKTELNVQNGAQTMTYTVQADNYEANRHYFLAQYFRDHYNSWLANTPIVQSPIQITKIEVYVTNRTSQFDQARNIAAFADLGEDTSHVFYANKHNGSLKYNITDTPYANISGVAQIPYPRNSKNNLYKNLLDTFKITATTGGEGPLRERSYNTAVANLTAIIDPLTNQQVFNAGREFEVLTRARRLNPATDYYLNPRLGYISLNTALNYDEVLSVSYQYILNGKTYQVGEFSDQFPSTDQLIITKLLKSTQLNTQIPMWDLMMKNVYTLGAYSLSSTNFQLNIVYNNIKTGVDIPYIPYGSMNGQLLIQKLGLDRINQNQDRVPDGYFDFIPNVTVNPQNGRIYFTGIEPFGNDLRRAFAADTLNHAADVNGFIFQELYDSTKISAQQLPNKDRFKLKGSYQSATSNEFSLNSMNIPQGSVRVTAGGVALTENVDYTVDYTMGKVKIINESVLNSGQAIKITAENNSLFNVQQKSMYGARFDYKYSKDLALGGTVLHYGERPLTQKVNIGDEPVSNTMLGIDYNYRANAPWLTRLVDKIPLIQTKEPSSIQLSGEGADLIPGHSKAISNNGGTSYIDDFEGSVSTIDLRSSSAWFHASIPEGQPNLFPETAIGNSDSIKTGINRAKIAWYTVDQSVFYQKSTLTPPQTTLPAQSNHFMEAFFESDLFPKKTPPNGQPQLLPMLDVAFYPNERGPYNYDTKPTHISAGINVAESNIEKTIILNKPETRWGGIMRSLTTNDFQASNIEYIQFWMMDPFNEDYNNQTQSQYNTFHQAPPTNGELYFNLGSVSEDILKDGSMAYENGIPSPASPNYQVQNSPWGKYPASPPYVNAFDIDPTTRPYQDVGYDCLGDVNGTGGINEGTYFANYKNELTGLHVTGDNEAFADPSGDNYHFYRGDDYDKLVAPKGSMLDRYKKYNNVEGNSPTQTQYQGQNSGGYSTVAITSPNIEDINKDNTLNQSESYYQYKVKITPQDINPNNIGNNYIVNVIPVTKQGADGVQRTVNFYQFKIPITDYNSKIGGIEGYNAIRFMRMFTKSFSAPVVMRFARLELVRSDWRVYQQTLSTPTGGLQTDNETEFDVSAVSYQENGTRTPIDYVLPPGINQQQNVQTTNLVLLNEQSLSLRVSNLKDGDARAVYKNITSLDARSYKNIRMFVHAEKLNNQPLNDGDVHMFMRIGSDFTNNYYVYEVPVKLTAPGTYDNANDNDKSKVWPTANEVVINLDEITSRKLDRNANNIPTTGTDIKPSSFNTAHLVGVVGEPNMGAITSIMIGIENPLTPTNPKAMTAEIWVDELRVTDFNQHGGQAAISKVTAKLADFGQVSLSGQVSTPFFGSIDAKPSDRSRQSVKQYALNGTFQLGKFLPKDWKINLPIYVAQSEIFNTPQYDPTNGDVLMSNISTDQKHYTQDEVNHIKNRAVDYTRQRGINFTNVSKQRSKNKTKMYPWDVENLSATYAFTEQYKVNVTTAWSFNRNYNGLLNYNYQAPIKSFEPFKNSKAAILQSPWLALIKEMNVKPLPGQFNFSTNVTRTYIESRARDITSEQSGQKDYTQTQYNKTFNVTRNYATRWDLTKNIKLDITATNLGRVLENPGTPGTNVTHSDRQHVEQNLVVKGGTNTNYNQTTNLNVLLPLNKIPALDFITQASGKYTANYQWQRRPFAVDTIGNTIQNAQTQAYTTQLNMVNLYNKIPYLKRLNQNLPKPKKDKKKADDKKKTDGKPDPNNPLDKNKPPTAGTNTLTAKPDTSKKKDSNPLEIFDHLARVLMTLKQISANYNITQGTTLPGFAPEASILGTSNNGNNGQFGAPGLGFVFGGNQGKMATSSSDIQSSGATGIVKEAENKNWLVHRQNFSTQYLHTKTQTFNYSANVEPIKSLKITLTGNMTHGQTESYFIGHHDTDLTTHLYKPGYDHYTPVFGGNYSISTITLGHYSIFKDDEAGTHNSHIFDNYLSLTSDYAHILSTQNTNSKGVEGKHYDGYGSDQQEVVIGAFISAYTGHKTATAKNTGDNMFKKIPLPGWNLTYDGLGKMPAVKKYFKSVVLTHGYRSTLSYGSYTNNQAYNPNHNARVSQDSATGSTSNFVSQYVMNTITVSESFSPLIKVNFMFVDKGKIKGLGANFEIKRDHISTLSSNVPQVMDLHSSEYNIGTTYTLPQVEIKRLKIRGKPLKSDLLSTVTLSFRQTQTAIRKAVDVPTTNGIATEQVSQISAGQNITTIKVSLTYSLTQNVNLRIYYDRTINKPVISTSFPTQTTNAGLSLRFVIQ